ncbi:MAG: OmpA family protein [Patescibacteria group bacterium]
MTGSNSPKGKLTPAAWIAIILALGAAVFFSVKAFLPDLYQKVFPPKQEAASVVPQKADLPEAQELAPPVAAPVTVTTAADPTDFPVIMAGPGCANFPEVRMNHWAWNSQMGLMYATGGQQSTADSLMCKHEVNLKFIRQDMADQMQAGLVAFATALKRGEKNPTDGVHFVAIMGDGAAAFLQGINPKLKELGPEYVARGIGSAGYSRGEDKFMGPPSWKANPQKARGGLIAGYLRDGDWNIAMKWAGDNGICNNPDEGTYDPNCLNWVNTADYIDAAQKYIAGYCDEFKVKGTKATKKVCVNGVVTWTPGDVMVAKERGGLVSVVSTREYRWQMPNTIIGIDKWMQANRSTVEGMLEAIFEGGDAVKSSDEALRVAAAVSHVVYHEKGTDPAYWYRYFKGVKEQDRTGMMVELGGSAVNNLADNLQLYGLTQGSANLFAATYTVFGNIVVQQYPQLVPTFPPVSEALDTSYVKAIANRQVAKQVPIVPAEMPVFAAEVEVKPENVVSQKSWQINFATGKATFTPDTLATIDQLYNDLLIAGEAAVEIHGHTDDVGDAEANRRLSQERALAVKLWLKGKSPVNFPDARVRVFGHGEDSPTASNATPEGRAENRRVEVILGTLK